MRWHQIAYCQSIRTKICWIIFRSTDGSSSYALWYTRCEQLFQPTKRSGIYALWRFRCRRDDDSFAYKYAVSI